MSGFFIVFAVLSLIGQFLLLWALHLIEKKQQYFHTELELLWANHEKIANIVTDKPVKLGKKH